MEPPASPPDAGTPPSTPDPGSADTNAELAAAQDEVLRLRAELDNQHKRLVREIDKARRYAQDRLIADLLPALDSLERGRGNDQASPEQLREGIELTHRLFGKTLADHGLHAIEPHGERFDPERHEAMGVQPAAPGVAPGTVVEVLQAGYRLHDRVLRPALVMVTGEAAQPATEAEADTGGSQAGGDVPEN